MGTGKSGDESRGASVAVEQRPGSYVQVSASRRKRKQGADAAGEDEPRSERPLSAEQPITASELGARRAEVEVGAAFPVDDLRPTRTHVLRGTRRAVGPLGMGDEAPHRDPSQPPVESVKRGSGSARPRVNVVEINPPELSSEEAQRGLEALRARELEAVRSERASASARPAPGAAIQAQVVRSWDDVREPLSYAEERPFDRPASTRPSARPSARPRSAAEEIFGEEPAPSLHPMVSESSRAAALAPAPLPRIRLPDEWERADHRLEQSRPSLSSVLDARASWQPSPLPPRERLSFTWWIVIGLLCAVIATAGLVALHQMLEDDAPTPAKLGDVPSERELAVPSAAPAPSPAPALPAPGAHSVEVPIEKPATSPAVNASQGAVSRPVRELARAKAAPSSAPRAGTTTPTTAAAAAALPPGGALPGAVGVDPNANGPAASGAPGLPDNPYIDDDP